MSQPTVFFFFCGRCGAPEKKGLNPKKTLIIDHVQIDGMGTMLFDCRCITCGADIKIPWTVEENLKAMEEAKFKDIDQFRSELDDGSFWDGIDGGEEP